MKYDVIVIGAGSAGGTLATRLAEDPNRSVLLLEAGPDYQGLEQTPDDLKFGYAPRASEMGAPHNWSFTGKGSATRSEDVVVPRGRVVGGTSAINGQVFLRGVPEDYDSWAEWGNDEWSFVKCLPYFRKLETDTDIVDDFHGNSGPVPVRRHRREAWLPLQEAFHVSAMAGGYAEVYDHNHPDSTGVGPLPMNNPNGVRMSTALTYIADNRHRLNFTIRGNVLVNRILFDSSTGSPRAVGVEVESGGETFTVEADQVVLSAGAVASPQILMLSGVGPASHLQEMGVRRRPRPARRRPEPARSSALRRSRQDPVQTSPSMPRRRASRPCCATPPPVPTCATTCRFYRRPSPRPLAATPSPRRASGSPAFSSSPRAPERSSSAPPRPATTLTSTAATWRKSSTASVCARPSACPSNSWSTSRSSDIVEEAISPTREEIQSDDSLDAWMLETVDIGQHLSGTCKMGPASDPMAVVDQFGRVHGIGNLRVADASVMPDVIRANTNLTTIMIGERVADWLIQQTS